MIARILAVAPAIMTFLQPGALTAEETDFPIYVGRGVCLTCHTQGRSAKPCAKRHYAKHARSFDALSRPEARHIAALSGLVEPPMRSRICLSCHATGADEGPRWTADTFRIEDGVQCEACHGPGSKHVAAHQPPPEGNVASNPDEARLRRSGRWDCAPCHVDMPSHREVLELGFRLDAADAQYKTPVNLALSPDDRRLYVVCEHGDSLIVVDVAGDRSPSFGRVLHEIPVGRRPHDVAVAPDGATLYVTNRMDDSVSVIDVETSRVVGEIAVGHEPHGVLTDFTGRWAFVADTGEDSVSVVDLVNAKEERRLVAGRGPWSLTMTPDGALCYVTSVRPDRARFRDPPRSEVTVIDVESRTVKRRILVPEANMLQGVAAVPGTRFALFTMMRTKNLVPITRLAQGWVITNGLGIIGADGRVDQVLLDEPDAAFADPTDVAVSPDGRQAMVAGGGVDRVAVVDVEKLLTLLASSSDGRRAEVLPNHLGLSRDFVIGRVRVGRNPRSVVYSHDGRLAFVAAALDDAVTVLDTSDYRIVRTFSLGGPVTVTQIRRGERLFHSASNTFAQQFSCRSCHPDGHVNGLTFDIEADGIGMHPVDNRTLRGIFDTPPFKWEGTNPTIDQQCGPRIATFFTRLQPYSPDELAALVRYICTIERPPNRFRDPNGLTPAQRRGKRVFNHTPGGKSEEVSARLRRCGSCHNGAYFTNRRRAEVGSTMWFDGLADIPLDERYLFDTYEFGALGTYYFLGTAVEPRRLDVPHLRNVYDSPPYLHNGAAATLEEIWTTFNIVDRHGHTGNLTRRELNDLIAYIKSL